MRCNSDINNLNRLLRHHRKRKTDIGRLIGVTRATVTDWLNCRANMDIQQYRNVCGSLGYDVRVIIFKKGETEPYTDHLTER